MPSKNSKRETTKAKRAAAFKAEQTEAQSRVAALSVAIRRGDMAEVNRWFDLLSVSLEYLNFNDPRLEK